jgi:hypothetical protein
MENLVEMNEDLGDPVTEDVFETLVEFNIDMRTIALSALQLENLMDLAIQENNLILKWLEEQKGITMKRESRLNDIEAIPIKSRSYNRR